MTDTAVRFSGEQLLIRVCSGVAGVHRDACGRGPSRSSAHWAGPDLLVVLMHGGFTIVEETLRAGGAGQEVRGSRLALADLLEPRLTALVEDLTGREVLAFLAASHQEPDYQLEAFTFRPQPLEGH